MKEKEEWIRSLAGTTEDRIFLSRILDKLRICEVQNYMTHTKFMDLRQRSLAIKLLQQNKACQYLFDGGRPLAERCVLIFYPDYLTQENVLAENNHPICLIRAEKNPADQLSHRDYLGSLMGLGIERECVGDIVLTETGADLLVLREISDFLLLYYSKAGKKRLKLSKVPLCSVREPVQKAQFLQESVASLRLDCAIAAAFGLSRSEALEQITKGLVFLNFVLCTKGEKEIAEGDNVTVRGKGKVEICDIGGKSRKGRIFIKIKKFI